MASVTPERSAALLEVDEVTVRFGGIVALDGATFEVGEGEILGLIGPNGAGKTTLFNCVSRLYTPTSGRITFAGQDLLRLPPHGIAAAGIARTFQNLGLFHTMTVLQNVMVGAHTKSTASFVTSPVWLPGVRREERRLRSEAMEALERLELGAYADQPAAGLPFGTLKRIELARALVSRPRLLLLDEPATGLTHSEVDELADLIVRIRDDYDLTVLLVEHHMAMVMSISDKVVALDFGRKIAEGTPEQVRSDDRVIEAYLGTSA